MFTIHLSLYSSDLSIVAMKEYESKSLVVHSTFELVV